MVKYNLISKLYDYRGGGDGADVVVFKTCLYVGAAAFIREFQGSPLV